LTTFIQVPYTLASMIQESASPEELHKQAIHAAITCNWQTAIDLNQKILELEPQNTEVLNRLAKALFETGSYSQAKKIYTQVLEIDPYNTIAEKNLKKASSLKKDGIIPDSASMSLSPSMFLEEPGITTLVNLVKIAEPQKLLKLSPGTVVTLVEKKRGLSVTDSRGIYLGAFPDDSAFHLLKLLKGGNKFMAIIKSVRPPSGLTVLIRETYRSKKFKNQASFLDESRIVAFSSENISLAGERIADDSEETGPSSEDLPA
jgi:tetratricopeptide (TPR) repeat protein